MQSQITRLDSKIRANRVILDRKKWQVFCQCGGTTKRISFKYSLPKG